MAEQADAVEDVDFEEEILPVQYSITSYGADFLVDGLVNRMNTEDIVVPTFDPEYTGESDIQGFQRGFVWKRSQADRFIESLLLGMPVPGIFLVAEQNNQFLVLDGHQRLKTLQSFYKGVLLEREFRLQNVQEPWVGKTYTDLEVEDRRRLDSTIIHATILKRTSSDDYEAVYSIFERINTGGSPLQPQEIRVALLGGPFVDVLRQLNTNGSWRALYGPRSSRLKDQELILRFCALFERSESYRRPLKGFLNGFLADNRNRSESEASTLTAAFISSAEAIAEAIGSSAFRPIRALNAAVFDAVMIGTARRLSIGPIDSAAFSAAYSGLLANEEFREATSSSTAAEESVETRLRIATEIFAGVPE